MKRGKGIIQNSSTVQTIQDVCINNIKLKKLTFTIRDGCLGSTFGIALRRDCSQGNTALHEKDGLVTEFLLRKKLDLQDFMEIRFVIKSPKMFRKSLNSKN